MNSTKQRLVPLYNCWNEFSKIYDEAIKNKNALHIKIIQLYQEQTGNETTPFQQIIDGDDWIEFIRKNDPQNAAIFEEFKTQVLIVSHALSFIESMSLTKNRSKWLYKKIWENKGSANE